MDAGRIVAALTARLKAAGMSAGGIIPDSAGTSNAAPTTTEASLARTPFIMFHGDVDPTVSSSFSLSFKNLLNGIGVPNERLLRRRWRAIRERMRRAVRGALFGGMWSLRATTRTKTGKIGKDEFSGPPALFDRLDRNHDSALTKEEFDDVAAAPARP